MRVLLVGVGLAILVSACGGSDGNEVPWDPRLDEPYVHSLDDYEIRLPLDWTREIIVVSPSEDVHDGIPFIPVTIKIQIEDISEITLEEYVSALENAFGTAWSEYRSLGIDPDTIDGNPVYFHAYTFSHDEFDIQVRQLLYAEGGKLYIVTATAPRDRWDDYESLFDASLRSFRTK